MTDSPPARKIWDKETIFTIGHSNHPLAKFVELLKAYQIQQLADIRTFPSSKYNPQFNAEALKNSLAENDIVYIHLKELGGRRKPQKDSINLGWTSKGFQAYADYMQSAEFKIALRQLMKISREKRTVIMCAEAVPWRCHRQLVADALVVRGIQVVNILSKTSFKEHQLAEFAKVEGTNIAYPLPLFA